MCGVSNYAFLVLIATYLVSEEIIGTEEPFSIPTMLLYGFVHRIHRLLLALVMLVLTLKTCVPAVDAALTRLSGAARQTKTVQAFAALTERLREGEPVQEALSGSFEILTGAGN